MHTRPKVFCIGFMKTGTTSLNKALTTLGYNVSNDSWKWLHPIVKKDWEEIRKRAERWDAFEDNPIPLIYKELDEHFTGSKFILSTRDPAQWYDSVAYHIGTLRSHRHEWVFGRGKGLPMEDKKHTIKVFNHHNEAVQSYFNSRPNDLLVLDVSKCENWQPLCEFLQQPVPNAPFPHANKTSYHQSKWSGLKSRVKWWQKRLTNPLKIWHYRFNGYLPTPSQRLGHE